MVPMPELPPCTSSTWPGWMFATRKTLDHTVQATSGRPAASTSETPARHGQHLLGGRDDPLGVAATVEEGADLVADLPLLDAVTDGCDATADLEARILRRARGRRVVAEPLHDVGTVDPGRHDVDEHLPGTRDGVGHLVEDEAVGVSGLRDGDGAHEPEPIERRPARSPAPRRRRRAQG